MRAVAAQPLEAAALPLAEAAVAAGAALGVGEEEEEEEEEYVQRRALKQVPKKRVLMLAFWLSLLSFLAFLVQHLAAMIGSLSTNEAFLESASDIYRTYLNSTLRGVRFPFIFSIFPQRPRRAEPRRRFSAALAKCFSRSPQFRRAD